MKALAEPTFEDAGLSYPRRRAGAAASPGIIPGASVTRGPTGYSGESNRSIADRFGGPVYVVARPVSKTESQ